MCVHHCKISGWSLQGLISWRASQVPVYKQLFLICLFWLMHLVLLFPGCVKNLSWLQTSGCAIHYKFSLLVKSIWGVYFINFSSTSRTIISKHFQFHLSMSADKMWALGRAWPHKKKPLYSFMDRKVSLWNCLHSKARDMKLNGSNDETEVNPYTIYQGSML